MLFENFHDATDVGFFLSDCNIDANRAVGLILLVQDRIDSDSGLAGLTVADDKFALTATNHAKTYGLYPRKGTIAVGADADIAIWDPKRKETISQKLMHGGSDYTPYEGIEVTGWPVSTMVRGNFVVRDCKLVGKLGGGDYVSRQKSELAKPRVA